MEENPDMVPFLQRLNDSLVEQVKKYQISEAKLNQTVRELVETKEELKTTCKLRRGKIILLEEQNFVLKQENTRLAKENKELHAQMWSTNSTAARMPNPYTCVLPDNRLNVLKHAPCASPAGSKPHS
jgi:hypothetical protein